MPRAVTAGRVAERRLRLVSWIALAIALDIGLARAALDAGRPACDYCHMILSEPEFGGEIDTRSGPQKIYDSVECMAAAVLTDSVRQRDIRGIGLVNHDAPHVRVPLGRTVFLFCPRLASPMGLSLAAFSTRASAERACSPSSARLLDWRGVLALVDSTWFQNKLSVEHHAAIPRKRQSPQH